MIGQLQIACDGKIQDKVEMAIRRLKAFEPPEGYYVAFSGGKDSQAVYHLCILAGVKFDAHYSLTTVDPPELVQFIKDNYPDVRFERSHYADGTPVTMWNLIPKKRMPPTRIVRYCCEKLKESSGQGRITVTGVRWAESAGRKMNQGTITFTKPTKKIKGIIEENVSNFIQTNRGGVVLNTDNDEARRTVEFCYRTSKTLLNPIIDWEDEDVWEFLNSNGIPHCRLYDEGYTRIGCIGCPMSTRARQEFERWPKYRQMYLRAFEKMIQMRLEDGLPCEWKTAEEVMDWWLRE